MNPVLNDRAEVDAHFSEHPDVVFAVKDARDVLFLLSVNEDHGVFYVGVPFQVDEDGTDVDPHKGYLDVIPEHEESRPQFPLFVLAGGNDC